VQKQFERTQVGCGFWLWWLLASSVGLAVGGSITGGALVWLLRHHIPDAAGAIEVE
jgi:hypothetical protein